MKMAKRPHRPQHQRGRARLEELRRTRPGPAVPRSDCGASLLPNRFASISGAAEENQDVRKQRVLAKDARRVTRA